MSDQKSVSRTLWVMRLLKHNLHKPIDVIASRAGISVRTAYRTIDTLNNQGFKVTRRYGTVYTMEEDGITPIKTKDKNEQMKPESGVILQRPCQDLKKARDTYEVLEQLQYEHKLDDSNYLRHTVANVTLMQNAVQRSRKVQVTYDSNMWNKRQQRIVEPYTFFFFFNFVWCYDCQKHKNIPLRISRMGDVKILDEKWENGHKHRKQIVDAFGCWGHYTKPVKLRMTMRARNLMMEAHPISIRTIKEDPDYPDGERWILETGVCDYSGITRYILGMLDEVEILEGEGLKEYIREWRDKIMAVEL